jgi:hypothetical protein
MTGWKLRAALLAVAVGFGVLALPTLPASTASASNVCEGRPDASHTDAWGRDFDRDQVCPNAYGAPVYYTTDEDADDRTGVMYSTSSWFVCYVHAGEDHRGGNDVWYYTQADVEDADGPDQNAWGYMPAWYVYTNEDPDPGMPRCYWDLAPNRGQP